MTLTAETVQDFQIDGGARATIEVLDESGEPIYGYNIVFSCPGFKTSGGRLDGSGVGICEFHVLPREMMQVSVSFRDYIPQQQALDLTTGKGSLSFMLVRGAMIHGSVVDSNGRALEDIWMRWTPVGKDPSEGFNTYMYQDLIKRTGPVVPGSFVVDMYQRARHEKEFGTEKLASQTVQLMAGENEITLVVDCPRVLYVQVDLPEGAPEAHLAVFVRKEGASEEERFARSGSNGRAMLAIFPPAGNYLVYALTNSYVSTVASVLVSEDRPTELTLTLKKPDCVRLIAVEVDSTAYTQGMRKGDLLVEYDLQHVASKEDLFRLIKLTEGREGVALVVIRDGKRVELQVDGGSMRYGVENACK